MYLPKTPQVTTYYGFGKNIVTKKNEIMFD